MCELLGLSSNLPATLSLSLERLAEHGGPPNSIRDGWCRVALNWALPHFVWRNYPETGKFRRDSCEFEEAPVAWGRSFDSKRRAK